MDDLLSDFLTETAEHIEGIESYLVLFEQRPDDRDAVAHIFRHVHTIKGTCGFLGLDRLQTIAHAAETLIDTLRNGIPPTAMAVSLLLEAMDRIKHLVARIAELGEEPSGSDADISGKIEAYLRGEPGGENPSQPERQPPADPGSPRHRAGKTRRTHKAGRTGGEDAHVPQAASQAAKAEPVSAPAACSSKQTEQTSAKEKASDTIRITVATIQRLMDLVSELVLTRNQLMEVSRQHAMNQIKTPLERLSAVTSDLQDAVMRARMQPMSRLFAGVPRLVRELSSELQKKYTLVIDGEDTELDRQLIEAIRDPLTHLIRNCADHGIESPRDRAASGKPEAGQISISAFYESSQVHIEISDDGRGLDADRIRETAAERGFGTAESLAGLSDDQVYRFILEPGFSTAKTVTKVSGRGVGMDVVRTNIESIGGTIALESTKGRGSKFVLKIPLTLAIAPALIASAGGQRFAIPQHCVLEAVSVEEDGNSLHTVQNALVLQLRNEIIPVAELATILELPPTNTLIEKFVVVLGLRGRKFGIIVDEIAGIQEIVVQPLGPLFSGLKVFSGNTTLGDGSIVLIVDPAGIAEAMHVPLTSEIVLAPKDGQPAAAAASNLILFKAGSGAAKVIPRSAVLRIVRVETSAIPKAGGFHLHRYQNGLIPVLPVEDAGQNRESGLILVISFDGKTFGLLADEVVDMVETAAEIQLASTSPSMIGTMDLDGVAAEFIDLGYYYRAAYDEANRAPEPCRTNLLIIGNESGMNDMLSPMLAAAGYKTSAVETAGQANELLQHMDFGVILLDAKSRAALDEAALSRQSNALCLILDEGHGQTAEAGLDDIPVSRFDRHRILDAIAHRLGTQTAATAKAADPVDTPVEKNLSFG